MADLAAFGAYLPERRLTSAEVGDRIGKDAAWIIEKSGIEERRVADESLVELAVKAGLDCLAKARVAAADVNMLIVSSGSGERQFPGPAAEVAKSLGLQQIPALDVPMASAGALFGIAMATEFTHRYPRVLVIAAEKMSPIIGRPGTEPGLAMLFGDGAGACLVTREPAMFEIVDYHLESDGAFAQELALLPSEPMTMNGMAVILQAGRKIPAAIRTVLQQVPVDPAQVYAYVMHQANQNLIDKVARSLGLTPDRFYSNIRRYGNTSSASMLIAASEWWAEAHPEPGSILCLAAFGAGFHWGALAARKR